MSFYLYTSYLKPNFIAKFGDQSKHPGDKPADLGYLTNKQRSVFQMLYEGLTDRHPLSSQTKMTEILANGSHPV